MARLAFVDTNIFVYAQDARDQKKKLAAQTLLEELIADNRLVISSQVVQEFCNVMLKGDKPFMSVTDLKTTLSEILYPLIKHFSDGRFYDRALALYDVDSRGFYDAMIVQAALDLNCDVLYSEDLQDGRKYGKLTVVNPFK